VTVGSILRPRSFGWSHNDPPNKRSDEGWVDSKPEYQQDLLGTDNKEKYGRGGGVKAK